MVESELFQTKKIFKEFLENIKCGVVIYEAIDNGNYFIVKEINRAGLDICKVSRNNIVGKKLSNIFPNVRESGFIDMLKRVWKTGKSERSPRILYQDDRIYDWAEVYIYKLPSEKLVVIFESITKLVEAEQNFKKKVEFEKIISTITSRFVNPDDVDEAINLSLKDIGILSNAHRSYLFRFDEDSNTMSNTHEWCSEEIISQKQQLQNIPMAPFHWSISRLKKGEVLNIEKVEDLPSDASAEKAEFLKENIRSLIFLPFKIGDKIAGFLGFNNVCTSKRWNEDDVNLLKISSDIIGNSLKRKETEQELEQVNKELQRKVKRRKKELEESEREKSIILESLLEHIVYQTPDNTILWVNKAAADSVNLKPDDLIGRKCYQIWNNKDEPCLGCPILKSIRTKKPEFNEMTTTDGRIWSVAGYPIKDKDNEVIAVVESTLEITEKKMAEYKLKQSEVKYKKAYYQANLYKDIFAHDINNILQNIFSSVELSALYLNNPKKLHTIKELYEIIDEQVNRAKKLITNVRKITEIDESNLNLELVDITCLLKSAIEFVHNSFQQRNIDIQVNYHTKKIDVVANSLLVDVFENILINAVRYNEKSKIEIQIDISKDYRQNKEFLKMEFKDNGIGISDYRKNTIFERSSRKRYKSKGLGLGLSLVKKIIDSYDGEIWVEDMVEGDHKQGSNFVILIPSNH